MIKSIRLRNPQRPFIVQQLIYNHRDEPLNSNSNSEASFLKMSETTSQHNKIIQDYQLFAKMKASINRLENKSKLKLSQVQNKLQTIQPKNATKSKTKKDSKLISHRQILEQNKQNLKVTYRQIPRLNRWQEETCDAVNFEMDQNRNYVKDMPTVQQNPVIINPCESRDIQFLQSSRKFQILQNVTSPTKTKIKSDSMTHLRSNSLLYKGSGQLYVKKQNPRIRRHSSSRDSRQKHSDSQEKDTNRIRGKVYEQILSLYSTAKLLAMEKNKK